VLFTSGTTGRSKGSALGPVVLGHDAVLTDAARPEDLLDDRLQSDAEA
jgi:acyl-coenzyme A synthetase/AMP-(fatty) acid ligase